MSDSLCMGSQIAAHTQEPAVPGTPPEPAASFSSRVPGSGRGGWLHIRLLENF